MSPQDTKLLLVELVDFIYKYKDVADFWELLEQFKKLKRK